MPDLNIVDTAPDGTEGQIQTPFLAVRKAGYNYANSGGGYLEFGNGTDGSLPFRVDQSGNVTAASITGASGSVDWLNLSQYGVRSAAGTALNAAMAALPSKGGVIYIPAGTWTLDTAVLWSVNNLNIIGDGWSTQIAWDGTAIPTAFSMTDTTNRRINMRDLAIVQTNASAGGTAIDASYCQFSRFQNINFSDNTVGCSICVKMNHITTYYNLVENCRGLVHGAGSYGVYIDSTSNSNIIRNFRVIGDSNLVGAYINANGIILERLDVESAATIGIDVGASGNNVTIINPYLESLTTGIQLEAGSGPVNLYGGDLGGCTTDISDLGCKAFSGKNYWNKSFKTATYDTSIGGVATVIKASDGSPVNNSSALISDPSLTLPVLASAVYKVQCWTIYDSGTTPDIKFAFNGPSGATMQWTTNALGSSAAGGTGTITVLEAPIGDGGALPAGGIGAGTEVIANLEGILTVSTTAGSLVLRWAQNTADPSNTFVRANSWLQLTRIA